MQVALFLARFGASQAVVAAGLLHDVVEDAPQHWSLERLEREFGAEVAGIVGELTEDKRLGWAERKRAGIEKAATMSASAVLVKTADKWHNLHGLARQLAAAPDAATVWARFRGGREDSLRVARDFVHVLGPRLDLPLREALELALAALLDADRASQRRSAP